MKIAALEKTPALLNSPREGGLAGAEGAVDFLDLLWLLFAQPGPQEIPQEGGEELAQGLHGEQGALAEAPSGPLGPWVARQAEERPSAPSPGAASAPGTTPGQESPEGALEEGAQALEQLFQQGVAPAGAEWRVEKDVAHLDPQENFFLRLLGPRAQEVLERERTLEEKFFAFLERLRGGQAREAAPLWEEAANEAEVQAEVQGGASGFTFIKEDLPPFVAKLLGRDQVLKVDLEHAPLPFLRPNGGAEALRQEGPQEAPDQALLTFQKEPHFAPPEGEEGPAPGPKGPHQPEASEAGRAWAAEAASLAQKRGGKGQGGPFVSSLEQVKAAAKDGPGKGAGLGRGSAEEAPKPRRLQEPAAEGAPAGPPEHLPEEGLYPPQQSLQAQAERPGQDFSKSRQIYQQVARVTKRMDRGPAGLGEQVKGRGGKEKEEGPRAEEALGTEAVRDEAVEAAFAPGAPKRSPSLRKDVAREEERLDLTDKLQSGLDLQEAEPERRESGILEARNPERASTPSLHINELPEFVQKMVLKVHPEGKHEAKLKLSPPELGDMDLSIQIDKGEVKLLFTVEHPKAADLVQQHLRQLEFVFQGMGLELGGAEINLAGGNAEYHGESYAQASENVAHAPLAQDHHAETQEVRRAYSPSKLIDIMV